MWKEGTGARAWPPRIVLQQRAGPAGRWAVVWRPGAWWLDLREREREGAERGQFGAGGVNSGRVGLAVYPPLHGIRGAANGAGAGCGLGRPRIEPAVGCAGGPFGPGRRSLPLGEDFLGGEPLRFTPGCHHVLQIDQAGR